MAPTDMKCPKKEKVDVKRPLANFPPDIWGEHFVNFTPEDLLMMQKYETEMKPMKEEVRKMIMDDTMELENKMKLIDDVERLGVYYFYDKEINESINNAFEELCKKDFNINYDLYTTASMFRVFRHHGLKMPSGVFEKFTNSEGEMKETMKDDVEGMVSLYEACHVRVHGDDILDKALVFTTEFLKSVETISVQASRALKQVSHFGIQRVESRRYISVYEDNVLSRNELLLNLAMLEFNRLQLLYRQELSQILRWWHKLDMKTKVWYARQRSVECHFWAIAMYFEPQYSYARMLFTRYILLLSIIDDTYDAYAIYEEREQLAQAFESWNLSAMDKFPEDFMKTVLQYADDTIEYLKVAASNMGKSYAIDYIKKQVMELVRTYNIEGRWLNSKYVPKFEEYMANAKVTLGARPLITACLLGMNEIADEKPFQQMTQPSKAMEACEVIGRLMDDIVGHKEEQEREHVKSSVECYMKEYGMNREQVVEIFNKMVQDAWKDFNEAIIDGVDPKVDTMPRPVLLRIMNFMRAIDTLYKVIDGYTHSKKLIKEDIIMTYRQQISI